MMNKQSLSSKKPKDIKDNNNNPPPPLPLPITADTVIRLDQSTTTVTEWNKILDGYYVFLAITSKIYFEDSLFLVMLFDWLLQNPAFTRADAGRWSDKILYNYVAMYAAFEIDNEVDKTRKIKMKEKYVYEVEPQYSKYLIKEYEDGTIGWKSFLSYRYLSLVYFDCEKNILIFQFMKKMCALFSKELPLPLPVTKLRDRIRLEMQLEAERVKEVLPNKSSYDGFRGRGDKICINCGGRRKIY